MRRVNISKPRTYSISTIDGSVVYVTGRWSVENHDQHSNWLYFEDVNGTTSMFRKEHVVSIQIEPAEPLTETDREVRDCMEEVLGAKPADQLNLLHRLRTKIKVRDSSNRTSKEQLEFDTAFDDALIEMEVKEKGTNNERD